MVDTAGSRSQLSHLATATMVLLVLLFLTGPLSHLPNAVLAAIVFLIGVKLIDYRGLAEIRRKSNAEFRLAVVTAATVVLVGVEEGILLAVVLSLLDHVRHGYRPHTAVLLQDPDDRWRMVNAEPDKFAEPGLVVYWFGADLYYANANYFAEQALTLVTQVQVPVHWLVLDAGAITSIDCPARQHSQRTPAGTGRDGCLSRFSPRQRWTAGEAGSPGLKRSYWHQPPLRHSAGLSRSL